jgi:hypothetical protein
VARITDGDHAVTPESLKSRRLVGLFLLGFLLFNYPILSLINLDVFWFGIPVLYFYMFFVWAVIIAMIGITTKFDKPSSSPPKNFWEK